MSKSVVALFDGAVLRPDEPIDLAPNTRVRITIEPEEGQASFLRTARSLHLEGPRDWSARFEEYLYGQTE